MLKVKFNQDWKIRQNNGNLSMPSPNDPGPGPIMVPHDAMLGTK